MPGGRGGVSHSAGRILHHHHRRAAAGGRLVRLAVQDHEAPPDYQPQGVEDRQ